MGQLTQTKSAIERALGMDAAPKELDLEASKRVKQILVDEGYVTLEGDSDDVYDYKFEVRLVPRDSA